MKEEIQMNEEQNIALKDSEEGELEEIVEDSEVIGSFEQEERKRN